MVDGAAITGTMTELVLQLDSVAEEADGRRLVEPYLAELRKLDSAVMEKIVLRQWWDLAREVVALSHEQQVDLSFAVRKAVRTLKDEADELLRTLNPKYGLAQQVSPAFQWAQNDTCIFLTIKYTVRWNAPGALEVTEPSVIFTENNFSFSGLGKHSNNKYKYSMSLSMFDNISPTLSTWSAASVGKLSVTLRKKWGRKWPRLLGDKKLKIVNMHMWSERQEALDSTLSGMNSVSNSPVTCMQTAKMYCLATDTCKKADNCSQCPGKATPSEELNLCVGAPTEKGSLSFKDHDMDEHEVAGEIKISKARNEFDIERYVVYFGKDERTKLEVDGEAVEVGSAEPTGADTEVRVPANRPLPNGASHLLVFSQNAHGEYGTPGSLFIIDAVLPKGTPAGLTFVDEDGEPGHISGTAKIGVAEDTTYLEEYSLHWGKSATRKTSFIATVSKGKDGAATTEHYFSKGTKIPDGSSHLIVYAKNSHGENSNGFAFKVVDRIKPCINKTDEDCPGGVDAVRPEPDGEITIAVRRAKSESAVETYSVYWGRKDCEHGGQSGAKNGHIKDIGVSDFADIVLPAGTQVPGGTSHILAFSKSKVGESNHCVSTSFEGHADKKEL